MELTDHQVEETNHSDHQGGYTDCNGLLGSMCQGGSRGAHTAMCFITSDTTKGNSSLSTSSEPHDGEVGQPANLEGNPGCKGARMPEASDDPKYSTMSSRQTHGKKGTHIEQTETK